MFKKLTILFVMGNLFLYVAGSVMASASKKGCKGWKCEEVYCPDQYAVRLPSGQYLPCEQFDAYISGDESVLIKKSPDYIQLVDEMIARGELGDEVVK